MKNVYCNVNTSESIILKGKSIGWDEKKELQRELMI
jgi:hypothetical protein